MIHRLQISVTKAWLFLLAGLMWSGVGVMLCSLAYRWLVNLHSMRAVWAASGGAAASLVVYRYGFLRIARRNIRRLHDLFERASIFAFMPAKSYLLVAFMMGLGMALRSSALPREYLSAIYTTIGAALFLSSLHYYPHAWALARGER